MGNVCSPSFSCDDTISHCLDCTVRKAGYITQLQDNLIDLQRELQKLIEARNDVRIRVIVAEQKQMKRLAQVQGWLSRVQHVEAEAEKLTQISQQEVEQMRLTSFCSKNCMSNYRFGKEVFKTLRVVQNLRAEGDFKDVAQTAPENPVDEKPIPSTIVGLQPTLEKVWRCLTEEAAGIIGIYGMGGVGKTTLLTRINNKFLGTPNNFDVIIWAVASKDLEIDKIQESIARKIGLFSESWKGRSVHEKALEIFKILSKKKFVLLLDDLCEDVDLSKVGLPLPSTRSASKVIFTTRKFEVCGNMESHKCFKVECLKYEDAWRLFEEKVGRDILDSHPNIPELAETVARECGGLPLALITVGRAMASKKTPQEWEYAIEVLRSSASKFSGMEKRVYSHLKFSYDFLPSNTVRFCLLYCSLLPEDCQISIEYLIDCWICEGFLDDFDGTGARNQGYSIIGTLLHACLLEEEEDNCVKMHDVIRDLALWTASTVEKEKEKFLVLAGVGLTEAPRIQMWEEVTRMSLIGNKIQNLSESPSCPRLRTLLLCYNDLQIIENDFFRSMPSLRVLNLSFNYHIRHFPSGISDLVSLQHLDLSFCSIKRLPGELKYLVNLKYLNLEYLFDLRTIPPQLISNLKMLRILRMFGCGSGQQEIHDRLSRMIILGSSKREEDSILLGGSNLLVEELLGLNHLNMLTINLRSFHALQRLLSSPRLQSSTRSLCLEYFQDSKPFIVVSLASLRHLERLHLSFCKDLEELKIEHTGELKKIRATRGFRSLRDVNVSYCSKLRNMAWLIFAPNVKHVRIEEYQDMEEIIQLDEIPAEAEENLIPFARLQSLHLRRLENLKSIYSKALQFPHLKEMSVKGCPTLQKLPLDCSSTSERKFIIKGEECWWKELQWDDEATQSAILPFFKSIDNDGDFN